MTNKIKFEIGNATGAACYNWTPAEYEDGYIFYPEEYEFFDIKISGKDIRDPNDVLERILIQSADEDRSYG